MPIKKSAIKHLRQTKRATLRNNQVRRELKEFIKLVRKAISKKDKTKLQEYQSKLNKILDKAAQKRVIAKNKAARYKSRLTKQINSISK